MTQPAKNGPKQLYLKKKAENALFGPWIKSSLNPALRDCFLHRIKPAQELEKVKPLSL